MSKIYKCIANGAEARGEIGEDGKLYLEINRFSLPILDCLPYPEKTHLLNNYHQIGEFKACFYPQQFFEKED
jgi:hypothetical protein